MMVVIVEFELRPGAESEFETASKHMQEQVKHYDGFLGEAPCRSIENEKTFVTLFYWRGWRMIIPPPKDASGSPVTLGSFEESSVASRWKRGPVAFRPRLYAGSAFSFY